MRFSELRESATRTRARRSAADMKDRRSNRHRKRRGQQFQLAHPGEIERGRGGNNRQVLTAAVPTNRSFPCRLTDTALARRRFFHLCANRVQVVGCGNHREQQNEHTSESAQEDQGARRRTFSSILQTDRRRPLPPYPIGGR